MHSTKPLPSATDLPLDSASELSRAMAKGELTSVAIAAVTDLAYALAAVPFGATRDHAIAVSLLIQTLQIIPVTVLGVAMAPQFLLKRKPRPALPR